MKRVLGFIILVALIGMGGLVFLFHHEIMSFSDNVLTARQNQDAIDTGNWADAIASYGDKVKDHPQNLDLAYTLGNLYLQNNQPAEAAEVFKNILAKDPSHLKATLKYGAILSQNPQKLRKALNLYRYVLKTNSDSAELLNALGDVYRMSAENPAEKRQTLKTWLTEWAIYYYRLASRTEPTYYEPYFNLGIAYQELKRLEKSATNYCNALILDPDSYAARYNLGLVLIDLGDTEQAYRELSQGVHLLADQGSPDAAHALAEKVQTIKNTLYNQNNVERDQLGAQTGQAAKLLNPSCLATGN